MAVKFTSAGSMAQITMPAALQTLANNTASLSSSAESNDDSAERMFFRNFTVKIGTQTTRTGTPYVYLLIVPYLGAIVGDTSDQDLSEAYVATDKDGNAVQWKLDAATTARNLTWANVAIPNSDYYIGVLNETGVAFAGTNEVWASAAFTVENVT